MMTAKSSINIRPKDQNHQENKNESVSQLRLNNHLPSSLLFYLSSFRTLQGIA